MPSYYPLGNVGECGTNWQYSSGLNGKNLSLHRDHHIVRGAFPHQSSVFEDCEKSNLNGSRTALNKESDMPPQAESIAGTTFRTDPSLLIQREKGFPKTKGVSAEPASTTHAVSGFHTPQSGSDSLLKAASQYLTNECRSPASRPSSSTGGIGALKAKLESLSLSQSPITGKSGSRTSSSMSFSSGSDQIDSYEVPLEHDFVSPDANTGNDASAFASSAAEPVDSKNINRKMCAADFEPLTCLGKGAFGTVFLVKHKVTGRLYAQKQFRKASITVQKKLVDQTKNERVILETVNRHPFVVKLFYAFQDHEKLYLILEYAQGGELFTHLAMERMFPEEVASFYMAEMVLALEHLHRNVGVIYRDLKPENCLLDADGHLLLTDFGLSKVALDDDDRCNSSLGTVEYMSPEVVQGKPYGKACDWWSLGAMGFDLLTGSPPFKGNNRAKIQERIVKQKVAFPYFLGPDARDLLTRLLRKEPKKRLGSHMPADIQIIKSHRFFRRIDWKALEARELDPPIKPLITNPELAENFSSSFTQLPVSPVVSTKPTVDGLEGRKAIPVNSAGSQAFHEHRSSVGDDLFGGFTFVAPSSLLDHSLAC